MPGGDSLVNRGRGMIHQGFREGEGAKYSAIALEEVVMEQLVHIQGSSQSLRRFVLSLRLHGPPLS